jgi:hypothetical protein
MTYEIKQAAAAIDNRQAAVVTVAFETAALLVERWGRFELGKCSGCDRVVGAVLTCECERPGAHWQRLSVTELADYLRRAALEVVAGREADANRD